MQRLIKKTAAILLGLGIILCLLLKSIIWVWFRNPQLRQTIKGTLDYTEPTTVPDRALIFGGMVIQLPWDTINDIGDTVFDEFGPNLHDFFFHVAPKEFIHVSREPKWPDTTPRSILGRIKNLIGPDLKTQYEADEKTWAASTSDVTLLSSPRADFQVLILLTLKSITSTQLHDCYRFQNTFMIGHRLESGKFMFYNLIMKGNGERINVFHTMGLSKTADPLLRSIRVGDISADFSEKAFKESNELFSKSAPSKADLKMAFLTAVETVTNEKPKKSHFIHLLQVCRRCHLKSGAAWLIMARHYFPSDKASMEKQFPEFVK